MIDHIVKLVESFQECTEQIEAIKVLTIKGVLELGDGSQSAAVVT